ncbi:MAG: hypothetical protein J0L92_41865 [Deltaproteobacteria bacterium]|jgi:hypothetical protein|nr:hypothetical protein [Deltaproteobacteria bacterium]
MRNGRLAVLGAMMWMTLVLAARAAAQAPPDVVELRNGGMVRGTLVENIPGDHVTIQIATGELRTFPSSEVLRVGPAPVAPVMTPVVVEPGYPSGMAVPQPPAPMVNLRIVGTDEELSLHRLTGTASVSVWTGRGVGTAAIDQFAIVCGAPCEQQLPAGTYTLGVSQGNGMARRADHSIFHLDHDATLELEYESREGVRIGGWVIFGVATLGYALGATLPLLTSGTDQFLEILLISTGIYLALCIPVIVMVALNDHADVREITETLTDGVRF